LALTPGTRLGPYEIVSAIGAGGMGEVYKARDTRLDRDVAIKILPAALASDPHFGERFDREARAISQLSHPSICTLYDVGAQDGTAFLVMELLDGQTLAARLEKGALPLDQALTVAIQIASALSQAHRAGITHRDLKPGNIMLTKAGAKLLDFGLAKTGGALVAGGGLSMLPTTPPSLTGHGMILGTFQYMAPEQLEGREADARSDLFAFGAVLYEMVTGRKAFEGQSQASLIGAILHATPPPIVVMQPLAPAALDRIVRTCLAKDPDERWQSAGDLKRELQWTANGDSPTVGSTLAVARHHPREYLAWSLATLATLVAIGASVLDLRAPRQADAVVRFTVGPPVGGIRTARRRFAVTQDGQVLALVAKAADGVSRIFVRRLDAAEAQPLAGTDNAEDVLWAPDRRSLAFEKDGGLYRVDLDGSAPRRLCDVPGNSFQGGTWSPRGVIVFASASGLLRVPDTGGMPSPVTTLESGAKERHIEPWFLPDGRHLLFLALADGQGRGVIWATSIDDPARVRLVESSGGAAYAAGWLLSTTPMPRGLVAQPFDPDRLALRGSPQPVRDRLTGMTSAGDSGFVVSSSGVLVIDRPPAIVHQLVWVDRTGRTVGTVGPSATVNSFALAPDERRVMAETLDSDSLKRDLWLFDGERTSGTRVTYLGGVRRPLWVPDGRQVYFTTGQGLGPELRLLTLSGTTDVAFDKSGSFATVEDITRDRQYLVLSSTGAPKTVWIQQNGSPGERRVLIQGQFSAVQPRVSPDRHWLAYTLALPAGPEVFVQPFDRPGDRIQASAAGGSGAVWRDDGRELYYEGPEGMMAVPMSERNGALEAGMPQKLFALRTQGLVTNQPHNVEVGAHGQKFLVNTILGDSDNVPLEVTLNWTTGLKK
jgi:eukaryotic-like serine/threonine-protein kinase